MGVVDLGLTVSGHPYNYSTMGLLGSAEIGSLSARNATTHSAAVTLQLNGVFSIGIGHRELAYWVQNVVGLDTATQQVSFWNNIWNFSSPGAPLAWPWVVGNGSTDGQFYQDQAGPSLPGSVARLSYPLNVSVEMLVTQVNGTPAIRFLYDDGFGWRSYDTAIFRYAFGWSAQGFWVNGSTYTPNGDFYDAEWVYGGPGNGSSVANQRSDLDLRLDFYNGHNFQGVLNAWNFGDTAESVSNVAETDSWNASDGAPAAAMTAGAGGLGPLYNRSYVAVLDVASDVADGTLLADGVPTPYVDGMVNVTLGPGTYALTLENGSGTVATRTVTLVAGESLSLRMDPPSAPTLLGLPIPEAYAVLGSSAAAAIVVAVGVVVWFSRRRARRRPPDAYPGGVPLRPP
jgi:hypothetical protein